jgi:hypothetical protein
MNASTFKHKFGAVGNFANPPGRDCVRIGAAVYLGQRSA